MKFLSVLLLLLLSTLSFASEDEVRAQELFKLVRCMTCHGQSINDSESHLAQVMRKHIRDEIKSGKSDEEILDYIEDRYGKEAILKTSFSLETFWLWCAPFLLLAFLLFRYKKLFHNRSV